MGFLKRQSGNRASVTFSVRAEPDLRSLLEDIALENRQTLSYTINAILREALKDQLTTYSALKEEAADYPK